MNSTYQRLLMAAKDVKGWNTPSEICAGLAMGGYDVSEQTMTNWKTRGVSKDGRLQASAILGIRPKWLEDGTGPMLDSADPAPIAKFMSFMRGNAEDAQELAAPTRVPVVGTAQLGDNGFWSELETPTGYGDGSVMTWTNDDNAYAVRCRGDSMSPRIKDGEYVVVEPNRVPIPGDEVLVKHVDGRVMVKQFLYDRDGKIHLISINDAYPQKAFEKENILLFHYVSGIIKRAMWVPY